MRLRTATHLVLTLLIAAGLGVSAVSASAQTTKQKPSRAKPGTSSHRGKSSRSSKSSRSRGKMQKAPTADRITEIQQALAKNGTYAGAPNGKWDDSTTEAMRSFQQTHGLNPTGKLDAKTLQQLGLGATTAGVAPPTPLVNSTSRLTSSAIQPGTHQ
jgi:murein L,D-transpeptidase YcbB/YkuD